jgi:hypothetical protein
MIKMRFNVNSKESEIEKLSDEEVNFDLKAVVRDFIQKVKLVFTHKLDFK